MTGPQVLQIVVSSIQTPLLLDKLLVIIINAKEVAQTADDGYEASNKKYLEDIEMAEISI